MCYFYAYFAQKHILKSTVTLSFNSISAPVRKVSTSLHMCIISAPTLLGHFPPILYLKWRKMAK